MLKDLDSLLPSGSNEENDQADDDNGRSNARDYDDGQGITEVTCLISQSHIHDSSCRLR
jgi:hypothetical protein